MHDEDAPMSGPTEDWCDRLSHEFESSWQLGHRPRIESFLDRTPAPFRPVLFKRLLAREVALRRDVGESPSSDEYFERFATEQELISAVFKVGVATDPATDAPAPLTGPTLPFTESDRIRAELLVPTERAECASAGPPDLPGYLVHREVGRGGMGVVYEATQLSTNRHVALKVLSPRFAADREMVDQFVREARLAGNLDDSRLITVFDVMVDCTPPVIVMRYIEGVDLGQILVDRMSVQRSGSSPEGKHRTATLDDRAFLAFLLPVIDQLIDAVAAVQAGGVIHRDIKPANVLVSDDNKVYLTDFGLAKLAESPSPCGDPTRWLGTHGFISPEQHAGLEADIRTDIFGLGVTIYQALTQALPYGQGKITPDAPRPKAPGARHPELKLPPELDRILLKALELDRDDRYPTASAMREDWQRARGGRRRSALALSLPVAFAACSVLATSGAYFRATAVSDNLPLAMRINLENAARRVEVVTDPPGARAVLVPLDRQFGEPIPDRAIRPPTGRLTPVELDAPAGDYLVEVALPDGRYHQVYRRVPHVGETAEAEAHRRWDDRGDGAIRLPSIAIPPSSVTGEMASFDGNPRFVAGSELEPIILPEHTVRIEPFYLDTTEVTVLESNRAAGAEGSSIIRFVGRPDDAISGLTFDQAVETAERLGKRLPTEMEYEYAATDRGRSRYPWGDSATPLVENRWEYGPVRRAIYDRVEADRPVFGLYSNVVEWTSSWGRPYGLSADLVPPNWFLNRRIIRGGIWPGYDHDCKTSLFIGPRNRFVQARDKVILGVGFRCARSVGPQFLEPRTTLVAR